MIGGRYKVAKYIRLSAQDGDNKESESIENQRDLLNNFIIKHEDLEEAGEYVDDGFTGGNFDRPKFKQMIQDVEERKDRLHNNKRFIKIWKRSYRYRLLS